MSHLQQFGCVHLADLSDSGETTTPRSGRHDDLKAAIEYLDRGPEKRPAAQRSPSDEEIKQFAAEALQIETESRTLAEEQEIVAEKVEQTRPWGDFHLPAVDELGTQQLYFYRLTHPQSRLVPSAVSHDAVVKVINRDRRYEYWLVIAEQPTVGMPCEPEQLDSRSLAKLELRLVEIDQQREQLQLRRIALTRWLGTMRARSIAIADETVRRIATQRSLVDGPVFAVQGWVPKRQLPELEKFAIENTLAFHSRPPSSDDAPPTLLTNPRPIAGAEGAVTFFMTPGYRAWDPTWVMFLSFSAFFAMILADAGYGLVLSVILSIFYRKLGGSDAGRRFRQLATFMIIVTIGYGVLIGSYFGFPPPNGGLLDRFVIKSNGESIAQNREAMMLIAATIGVLHLVLANVIVAWRWLGSGHALSSVGWAIGLIGGWLLAAAKIPKPDVMTTIASWTGGEASAWTQSTTTWGWWLLGTGFAMVFLFTTTRPVFSTSPRDWLMRVVEGVMGLTGVSKAFGDTLSYLRLFALGLASAQLAITFNDLAASATSVPGVGVLLGLLIFLLGHTLNLLLAVVGGVVHGLRLNCIEFFSWSLTEEGQPFEAFEMRKTND